MTTEPLKWREENAPHRASTGHWAEQYSIYENAKTGRCVLSSGAPDFIGPYHFDTLEEAKAAAQAAVIRAGGKQS